MKKPRSSEVRVKKPRTSEAGMKTSLVVGIDFYPGHRLFGCVRDANNVDAFLRSKEYTPFVPVLLDARADTQTIKGALNDAIASLGTGDHLVFFFAGHGVSFPRNGENHEAICGVDFDGTFTTIVTDEELSQALRRLTPGASVTIIADSCFSGGLQAQPDEVFALARSEPFVVRTIGVPDEIAAEIRKNDILQQTRTFASAIIVPGVLLLAACGPKKLAGEHKFGNDVEGILTHYMLERLSDPNSDGEAASTTTDAIVAAIRPHFPQRPELHPSELGLRVPLIP